MDSPGDFIESVSSLKAALFLDNDLDGPEVGGTVPTSSEPASWLIRATSRVNGENDAVLIVRRNPKGMNSGIKIAYDGTSKIKYGIEEKAFRRCNQILLIK